MLGQVLALEMHGGEQGSKIALGKIAVRTVFHGLIPSGPEVTSMVMAMKMMIMTALMIMPVMMMLAMALIMQPRPLGLLVEEPQAEERPMDHPLR